MFSFAERLKLLRIQRKLSQKELADLLKITDRQYRYYEAGTIDPPSSKLILLADYFGVSLDYLTGRTDNPEINRTTPLP